MHINELRAWPVTLFQPSTVYLVKAFTPSSHGACWLCLKIHPPLPLCIISPLLLYYRQISSATHLKKATTVEAYTYCVRIQKETEKGK